MNLTESHLHTLKAHFHPSESTGMSVLGGRTAVTPVVLDDIGSVVIKHYRRGGLLRYLVKRRYLKTGKTRSRREFELLDILGNLGVNVPQPIAYASCGGLFYLAWLVTREIHQPATLASLSLRDEKKTVTAMASVIEQISLLVQNDILHVDLHPGNVVIDKDGYVYLLDFDKGRIHKGDRQKLTRRYLSRWQRAVRKHGLPEMLNDLLQSGF
jgi:3-deoxy-D-manno-octulosonic acid kinase